jgi:uncharacterized protein YjbI with pentapeptide repeats
LWGATDKGPKSCNSNIRVGLGSRGVLIVIGAFGNALATTKTTAPTPTATAAEICFKTSPHFEHAHFENAHFENAHFENAHFENAHFENCSFRKMLILKMLILKNPCFLNRHAENADFENAHFAKF